MKASNRKFGWPQTVVIMLLAAFVLAACAQTTPEATVTPTEAAVEPVETETPAAEEPSSGLDLNQPGPTAPTATPVVINLDGALVTDSGLQYLEETAGEGEMPKKGDLVTMNYIASLPDGTVLVDTYTQGSPVTTVWGADRLLPGWEEGLALMNTGAKGKLVLPPELAFGQDGGGAIPPDTQLILDIEVMKVEPAPVPTEIAEAEMNTSETGLQYYDLAEGDGAEAVKNSNVSTAYTVWIKTDTGYLYVDSSTYGKVVDFVIGRLDYVFPGWDEGVTGMKEGGKRLLVIPPDLAMGDQESGIIPANSTLVMEVELLSSTEPQVATEVDEEDFTITDSGLKYYDLVEGTGDSPEDGQTVVVHYTGWLEDGTQFDSSLDRGQPFSFAIGQGDVIPGWDEGVSTMKVGGKRQLVIPAELGYGAEGAGSLIPPGATLIFEVELLEIQADQAE